MDYLRARIEALENEVENLKKQVEFLEATKEIEVQKNELQIKIDKDYLFNNETKTLNYGK
jgi:dynactin complex subunit|tara:strand:- start:729 stop:908 length:180 start_codon:yes stop_codon:yes gene_type:complete